MANQKTKKQQQKKKKNEAPTLTLAPTSKEEGDVVDICNNETGTISLTNNAVVSVPEGLTPTTVSEEEGFESSEDLSENEPMMLNDSSREISSEDSITRRPRIEFIQGLNNPRRERPYNRNNNENGSPEENMPSTGTTESNENSESNTEVFAISVLDETVMATRVGNNSETSFSDNEQIENEEDEQKHISSLHFRHRCASVFFASFIFIVFLVGLLVGLLRNGKSSSDSDSVFSVAVDPHRNDDITSLIVSSFGDESTNPGTHQNDALMWLLNEDPQKRSVKDSRLTQRYILCLLYFSTEGSNWFNNNAYLSGLDECEWYGIVCDNNMFITSIRMTENNLQGTIPNEITSLNQLSFLYLSRNTLVGTIPKNIGNLTKLQEIDIDYNSLEGSIPESIRRMNGLVKLTIGANDLTGTIPSFITELTKLTSLSIFKTLVDGTIPSNIGNLVRLEALELEENKLNGTIPPSIGNLQNLIFFFLDENQQLTGSLPSTICLLKNLQEIFINENLFTGSIPENIGDMKSLKIAEFGVNKFNGTLPSSIGALPELFELFVYKNDLTGTIPPEIGNLSKLEAFSAGDCSFRGHIPSSIGNLHKLNYLNVDGSNLSGSIPGGASLSLLSNLEYIFFNDNRLTGLIPPILGDLSDLKMISFSNNKLQGTIPPSFENLVNLHSLMLGQNGGISGTIPPFFGGFTDLRTLRLRSMNLTGPIPELSNLTKIEEIDLSDNALSGTISTSMGALSSLATLRLNGNDFRGTVPQEVCELKNDYFLDDIRVDCDGVLECPESCCTCVY